MKPRRGQAAPILAEAFHQVGRILMLLFSLVVLVICLLGYQLSLGPLQIPHLASWLATAVSGKGITVRMQVAELAWAGYREGGGAPLDLQLGGISVRNGAGVELLHIPAARLDFVPAALFGAQAPVLVRAAGARFDGSVVPVSLYAALRLDAGFKLSRVQMQVTLGAGRLGAGDTSEPITAGRFSLVITPNDALLSDGVLDLATSGASAPKLTFSGTARRSHGWNAVLLLSADQVQAADLATYWPPGALPQTRTWVSTHITSGTASDAAFRVGLGAPENLADVSVTSASGKFRGTDLTLRWIPGVVPITGLNGEMDFLNKDRALVTAQAGRVGGMVISGGTLNITGMSESLQVGQLRVEMSGSVPALMAIINTKPLQLLAQAPPEIAKATGQIKGSVTASIPFLANLRFAQVTLDAKTELSDIAVALPIQGLDVTHGQGALEATGLALNLSAQLELAGEPATLTLKEVYQGTVEHVRLTGIAGRDMLHLLGLDEQNPLTDPVTGDAAFLATLDGTADGAQHVALSADLTGASLSAPSFGWHKPAGAPGRLQLAAELLDGNLAAIKTVLAQAPGLDIRTEIAGRRLHFLVLDIGGTQATGQIVMPASLNGRWAAEFSGPVLDVRAISTPKKPGAQPAPPRNVPPSGVPWSVLLKFDTLFLAAAPAPSLDGFFFQGDGVGGTLLHAKASTGGAELTLDPVTPVRRALVLQAPDAGLLLRALGAYKKLEGGRLTLTERLGGTAPAAGQVTLLKFRILKAPEFAKVLQGLTVYGAPEVPGPGLFFDRAVIPYTLSDHLLQLDSARAYSAALGFTASGGINTASGAIDIDGTIIPAYALNTLPGRIPVIGHLFTAEKGGGLFALRAKVTGQLEDPKVTVNPLSALTPGVLRDVFQLGGSHTH